MENITEEEILSITTYSEVCQRLNTREYTLEEFEAYRGHNKKFFAYFKLKLIEKLFNGNWIPDWNNPDQRKWYPYFYKDSSGGWVGGDGACYDVHDFHGSVAYFSSEKIATHAGKVFKDIYLDLIV